MAVSRGIDVPADGAPPAAPGVITFLFTDLVGSTELLARLGEARAEAVRRIAFDLMRGAVSSCSGREVKSLGDGLMVAFASPSDALACAVAMQRAFDSHNAAGGEQLLLRVGLQAGEAVPTTDRDDYHGAAVVQAKRLCEAAPGGQILASELVSTLASLSPHPRTTVGAVQLKGWPEAIPAVSVSWEPDPGTWVPLPRELAARTAARTPFAGRGGEWDRLGSAWRECVTGRRRLLWLAGEPGIGKTRFAAEFASRAHAEDAIVLWGQCSEEALVPYQPFVQALRHYVTSTPLEELRARISGNASLVARIVPEVRDRLPEIEAEPGVEPESERYRLFEAISALLADISSAAPLLLVLDDLQWADRATLLLLRSVALDPRPASLMVLVTYRDTDVARSHPLARLQADLGREQPLERIDLTGLSEQDVAAMLDSLIGHAPPGDLAHHLHGETRGNPFFLEEVVRHRAQLGAIGGQTEGTRAAVAELGVPERVKQLVARRVQGLSPGVLDALSVASVVGAEFDLDVVCRVLGEPENPVLTALDEAVDARLVTELPGRAGGYGFSHALVQHALYEDQSATRRASLHARTAVALEEFHGGGPRSPLAALAHHYSLAGERFAAKVVEHGRAAGEQALNLLAYEDATRELARALQALESSDPGNRREAAQLLVLLGVARTRAGEAIEARASFRSAAEHAEAAGDCATLARAALGYGSVAGFGGVWITVAAVDDVLVELLEKALALCPSGEDSVRVRLLGRLSQALYWGEDRERVLELSREALASARGLGDPAAVAYALDSRHVALWGPDDLQERLEVSREMLRLGEQLGDADIQLEALAWLITDSLEADSIEVVDGYIDTHARLAGELRQPYHLWYTDVTRAMRAFMEGRYEEYQRLSETAWSHGQHSHGENARQVYLVQTLFLRRELGQLGALVEGMEAYVAEAPLTTWRIALAMVYADLGRQAEALALLEPYAADRFGAVPRDCVWFAAMGFLSTAVGTLDAARHAEPLYELLLPFEDRVCPVGGAVLCFGPITRFLGILARVAGDHDRGVAHLENALESSRALGSEPLAARAQLELARTLLARRAGGDDVRAAALLREAERTARALGMVMLLGQIAELRAPTPAGRS